LNLEKIQIWQPQQSQFGLPTGIDAALKQLLPEVIYIEAFKDPSAEAMGKSTATLGKILGHILESVTANVTEQLQSAYATAERKLNLVEADGQIQDQRLDEIRRIEHSIKKHMAAIFQGADIRLRFQFPQVKDLFTTARLDVRDHSVWTTPEFKGQGFQRTLYLALLQALVDASREAETEAIHRPFILLFEEPEAFLHPSLQRQMGDTLEAMSRLSQVVIATHSPLVVTPARIEDVLLMSNDCSADQTPRTHCYLPDMNNLPDSADKHLANLLKLTNSAEFLFADCVLVVEGPSDRCLLEAVWSRRTEFVQTSRHLSIVEAGSKDAIHVWMKYLKALGIPSRGLVDLDFLWNGAGKCLSSDSTLSRFCDQFWEAAQSEALIEVSEEANSKKIAKGKKEDAFRLIEREFRQSADALRSKLREEYEIWVLPNGEIEAYFGLSQSSKGKYTEASQRVRDRQVELHSDITSIVQWAVDATL